MSSHSNMPPQSQNSNRRKANITSLIQESVPSHVLHMFSDLFSFVLFLSFVVFLPPRSPRKAHGKSCRHKKNQSSTSWDGSRPKSMDQYLLRPIGPRPPPGQRPMWTNPRGAALGRLSSSLSHPGKSSVTTLEVIVKLSKCFALARGRHYVRGGVPGMSGNPLAATHVSFAAW